MLLDKATDKYIHNAGTAMKINEMLQTCDCKADIFCLLSGNVEMS